jgi:hypothetical protein
MSIITLIPARRKRYGQDFRQQLVIDNLQIKCLKQPAEGEP